MPVVETFEGQLTRANVQLAVRSGVLTEAECSRYWQARRRYRTLSDSNSEATTEKRTQEFEEAKARVLECMNMNTNSQVSVSIFLSVSEARNASWKKRSAG